MLHFIIKSKLYNKDFVRDRTEGFDNFIKEIERQDVDELARVAGIDKQMVKEAAIAYATAKNSMEFHGFKWCRDENEYTISSTFKWGGD